MLLAPLGSGASSRHFRFVLVLALGALFGLLAPSLASATFVRPYRFQLEGTTPGTHFNVNRLGGLGTDAGDNLWVADNASDGKSFSLDTFDSSGGFLKAITPVEGQTSPNSIAIDFSTGHIFAIGPNLELQSNPGHVQVFDSTGALVREWGFPPEGRELGGTSIAVDNSSEPSAGSIYVASVAERTLSRFNGAGEPVAFGGSAAYIKGNKITGYPLSGGGIEAFHEESPRGPAVDSHGNVYMFVYEYQHNHESAVLEYAPSGEFVQAFAGVETPGLDGNHENGGFGGRVEGVASDPLSGDTLVSVTRSENDAAGHIHPVVGAVDEFDSSGHFLGQITETSLGQPLSSAVQMIVDSQGNLYVTESGGRLESGAPVILAYGPGHFVPGVRLGEVSGGTQISATLNGSVNPEAGVNPEHAGLTDCHFEYVAEAEYKLEGFSGPGVQAAPCSPSATEITPSEPTEDETWHQVHAPISGLTSGTTYRYRLVAGTAGIHGGTATTAALAFTAPHAPDIESTSAGNLSSTFADLEAKLNPLGASTSYYFQLVAAADYEPAAEDPYAAGVKVPVVPTDVGAGGPTGSSAEVVVQHVGSLVPGTAYHFRLVAANEIGTAYSADKTFATLPTVVPGLPDGRAYELITPPAKGTAEDMFGQPFIGEFQNGDVGLASESGNQFLLATPAAFGPAPAAWQNAYVFSRTASGWTSSPLAPPTLGVQSVSFTSIISNPGDFSRVGFADGVGAAASEEGTRKTTLLGSPGGPYETLAVDSPYRVLGPSVEIMDEEETEPIAGSRDLSRVFLQTKGHSLCPGPEAETGQDQGSDVICEYSDGEFKLVDVNDEGKLLNPCGAVLGKGNHFGGAHNAISADGSRAFLTAPDPFARNLGKGCWNGATTNSPQLYLRTSGETIQVSASEEGAPEAVSHRPAEYVGAAEDGSRVFFLSRGELTEDDVGIHDPELYEYNVETRALTRISHGESGEVAGNVLTVPAISADGSAVYFTAYGSLTAGAPALEPGFQRTGPVNLYRYATSSGSIKYVATINASDYTMDIGSCGTLGSLFPDGTTSTCPAASWYTTPDGRYLLFASSAELTGYSTLSPKPTACRISGLADGHTGHCEEVYRYDSASSALTCVSCNPTGAPPTSNALFGRSSLLNQSGGPVRALSTDGSYAFFDTADALVPQDNNGTLDVYEWHEGAVSLLSSGHDSAASFFLGASPDGSNVFLGTHSRLVPQDTDGAGDLYDARVGGGFPPPPSRAGECEGDACSHAVPAPADATPGSLTFSGAGNVHQSKHKATRKRHSKRRRHRRHRHSKGGGRR